MEHLPITQSFWVMWSAVETLNIATYSCVPGCMTMKKMSKVLVRVIVHTLKKLESNAMVYLKAGIICATLI